jgi:pimeloyl-ACP methyl ester carboxylesterase
LVLLPGMNCSARLWSGLEIGPALTPVLTEPTLDEQVECLLDQLPPRFALAGLSLGGIVAMALARRSPQRVSRLCLMSTNPHSPTPVQRSGWAAQRADLAAGAAARELQEAILPLLLSWAVLRERPNVVQLTLEMADEIGAATLDAQLRLQATRVDERPGLTQLRCPLLIIAAKDDALCGVDRHVEMAGLVPGARLVIVERCAHLSPLERPDQISEHLTRWRSW